MKIIQKRVSELIPYDNNPRFNDKAVEFVANSIDKFGFRVPVIIDKNNVIVAGHTRVKACEKLGLDNIPCTIADDLTPEQIKAYRLADNKVAEMSEWDFEKLEVELLELSDVNMELFGFDELEVDELVRREQG